MTTTGKRIYRNVEDDVKSKISQTLKNRSKSPEHIRKISDGLKKYWKTVPEKPNTYNKEITDVVI